MDKTKKGYWIYSIVAVIFGMMLLAFIGWLIYDLIIKLSEKDFSNNTVVQALITLVVTVFIGGYFSKRLELRNAKDLELYKIRKDISLTIVDLSSEFIYAPNNERIKQLLIAESKKVKLYFTDDALLIMNNFIMSDNKIDLYDKLIDELKKEIH